MKRLDDFVPTGHPLRAICEMVNKALMAMNGLFADMYEADIKGVRPSVAPEKLLRAMLLQVLCIVRSESMLMEQIQYNMLFRWFVGLAMDDTVWGAHGLHQEPPTTDCAGCDGGAVQADRGSGRRARVALR